MLSIHTLKPLDTKAIVLAARQTHRVVTLEEHSILGGLGGAAAEVLCEAGIPNLRFLRLGLPSRFNKVVGEQEYLRKIYRLDAESVAERIAEFCREGSLLSLRRAA